MKWLDKLNKREKAYAFAVILLIALWVVYTTIVEPMSNILMRTGKDIEIAKIEFKKSTKILTQREEIAKSYDKHITKFRANGSDEEEMALILNEIEAQARKNSVKIINMKPRRARKNDFYRLFYVDLDAEATMQNILRFIKALKDSKLYLCVEQITLNSRTSEPTILNSSLTVSRLGIMASKD